MKYTSGSLGRVFVLKFDNNDVVIDELARFSRRERVRTAVIFFIGALRRGDIVTGPKKPVIPPDPHWVTFNNAWEVFGTGTIFTNRAGPQIHLHAAMGQHKKVLAGCVRKKSQVFLVLEAFVFETKGMRATKKIDPKTGLNLLTILAR